MATLNTKSKQFPTYPVSPKNLEDRSTARRAAADTRHEVSSLRWIAAAALSAIALAVTVEAKISVDESNRFAAISQELAAVNAANNTIHLDGDTTVSEIAGVIANKFALDPADVQALLIKNHEANLRQEGLLGKDQHFNPFTDVSAGKPDGFNTMEVPASSDLGQPADTMRITPAGGGPVEATADSQTGEVKTTVLSGE